MLRICIGVSSTCTISRFWKELMILPYAFSEQERFSNMNYKHHHEKQYYYSTTPKKVTVLRTFITDLHRILSAYDGPMKPKKVAVFWSVFRSKVQPHSLLVNLDFFISLSFFLSFSRDHKRQLAIYFLQPESTKPDSSAGQLVIALKGKLRAFFK